MNVKKESMSASYLPVPWDCREVIEEEMKKGTRGKIFYFCDEEGVCSKEGKITEMKELPNEGVFLYLDNGTTIRIDRIITLYGKPGASYDEYDSYANACMECMGGYEKDEL